MKKVLLTSVIGSVLASGVAFAGVDKVYGPAVEQGELELEVRGVHGLDGADDHKVKFGAGYGINDLIFLEGYLVAEKIDGSFKVEDAEIEAKFQLSEQGEYWADFGVLVELEKELDNDKWEFKAGPIIQKQLDNYIVTANILFEKQFGADKSETELETLGSMQVRYRLGENLEPALEYYTDEHTQALGPVLLGKAKLANSKLKWELGLLFGMNDTTNDSTLRWQFEWEL